MKRQEYKLLVESWNAFLFKEEKSCKTIKQDPYNNTELTYLLEWGDKLENLIVESGDYLLLESLHESNKFIGKLVALKDKVKNSLKVRKDVVDDDGNKVKYDDSEDSQVKQEYTKLARTGMAAMTAIKIACIISAALSPHGLGSDKAPDTFEELPPPVQRVISNETGIDTQELSKVQHITFDAIKIGPSTQTMDGFDAINIGPSEKFKEKIALATAKAASPEPKNVDKETAQELLDKLGLKGGLPDSVTDASEVAKGEAISLGIDTSGEVTVLNKFESSQKADMTLANNIVKLMSSNTDLGKTDVNTKDFTPTQDEFSQAKKNFSNLSTEVKTKLLRAAKFKAIKDLMKNNKKVFDKAKSWTSTVWGFEGEGAGKDVSDMNHHKAEGSKEARAISALYGAFGDLDLDQVKNMSDIEKVLDGHASFTQVTDDNSIAGDIKGSIIAYVMKNCTDDGIEDLEENLGKINNIDKDLQDITMPATTYDIDGKSSRFVSIDNN